MLSLQVHDAVFVDDPSMTTHAGFSLHESAYAIQKKPVLESHVLAPHVQDDTVSGITLTDVPSVLVHAGTLAQ